MNPNTIALALVALTTILVTAYFAGNKKSKVLSKPSNKMVAPPRPENTHKQTKSESDEPLTSMEEIDRSVLGEFAFQHAETELVPDDSLKLGQRARGSLPFKFISSPDVNAYYIKKGGKFLYVTDGDDSGRVDMTPRDPGLSGSWLIKSGHCGSVSPHQKYTNEFIMIQHVQSGEFLTIDSSKSLVVKGIPTHRTRGQFCWRQTWNEPGVQRCGLQEYDGKLVNIPCEINDNPSEGCASATPGFKSACCGRNPSDVTCVGNYFREVVGHSIDDSILYLRTKYPHMRIRKCATNDRCSLLTPFPLHDENLIVVKYDARTGVVTQPAYRWI